MSKSCHIVRKSFCQKVIAKLKQIKTGLNIIEDKTSSLNLELIKVVDSYYGSESIVKFYQNSKESSSNLIHLASHIGVI